MYPMLYLQHHVDSFTTERKENRYGWFSIYKFVQMFHQHPGMASQNLLCIVKSCQCLHDCLFPWRHLVVFIWVAVQLYFRVAMCKKAFAPHFLMYWRHAFISRNIIVGDDGTRGNLGEIRTYLVHPGGNLCQICSIFPTTLHYRSLFSLLLYVIQVLFSLGSVIEKIFITGDLLLRFFFVEKRLIIFPIFYPISCCQFCIFSVAMVRIGCFSADIWRILNLLKASPHINFKFPVANLAIFLFS